MTLGELKVRCLKKIKVDDNFGLSSGTYEDYKEDRDYSQYANNLVGSINDAIKRLVINEKLPYKSKEYTISTSISSLSKSSVSISDLFLIKAILHEDSDGVVQNIEFSELPDRYIFGETFYSGKIIIIYAPTISEISESTDDTTNLSETWGLNDLAIGYIIYFVKCELYEDLEPDMAVKWRSYAESYLSAMSQELRIPTQKKVKQVIKLG